MKVIRKLPNSKAEVVNIDDSLESLRKEVGGLIEAVYPFEEPVALICNDEGKLQGAESNVGLFAQGAVYDVICGPMLIVGLSKDDFTDLADELCEKYVDALNNSAQTCLIGARMIPCLTADR